MKSLLRFSALTTLAVGLSSSAFSQVWLESVSSSSIQFVVRAATSSSLPANSVAVAGDVNNSWAGARFNITFTDATLTVPKITITVTNLSATPASGYGNTASNNVNPIGTPPSTPISFREGTLWDFGFEIRQGLTLIPNSSTITALSSGETVDQTFVSPNTIHIADYSTDVGVQASNNGLGASTSATYTFAFSKSAGYDSTKFNPTDFWKGSNNTPSAVNGVYDFTAVFVNTENKSQNSNTNNGWDKVAVNFDSMPIPEPSTYGLIGAGALVGMIAYRRRRSAAAK